MDARALNSNTIIAQQETSSNNDRRQTEEAGAIIRTHKEQDTIHAWANQYFHTFVVNTSPHTQRAKHSDIEKFLQYFVDTMKSKAVNLWTPALTRGFQNHLTTQQSPKTKTLYIATTINRVLATLSHFAHWLHTTRPLLAGNPFAGVKMIQVEDPAWNGLTTTDVTRLKAACDIRMNACNKKLQNPLLETTVFYVLLQTGLRESELAKLNYGQYHERGFHDVRRKGNKISKKIPLPSEAKDWLDKLIAQRLERLRDENKTASIGTSEPLIVSRYGQRISTRDIARICERISNQASAHTNEKIRLTPHMLRHTLLKRVADKHGTHVAQDFSGNISVREVFRYTKPSLEQKYTIAEQLY